MLLFGALLCDLIWRLRNEALFKGRVASYKDLKAKIVRLSAEHCKVRSAPQIRGNSVQAKWVKPEYGSIKLNVDAAVGAYHSVVVVIARDWRGELVFACSKKVNTTLPLQVEAEAILWAMQLAEPLNSASILVEGDSQVCFKSIAVHGMDIPWAIENAIQSVKFLASNLPYLSFGWVPREANGAAHSLAKWSLLYSVYGYFDFCNNPSCFVKVIREEAGCFVVLWPKWVTSNKIQTI